MENDFESKARFIVDRTVDGQIIFGTAVTLFALNEVLLDCLAQGTVTLYLNDKGTRTVAIPFMVEAGWHIDTDMGAADIIAMRRTQVYREAVADIGVIKDTGVVIYPPHGADSRLIG